MIELRAGRLRCEVVPELGGCIAALWLDELAVLRSTPAARLESAWRSGCHPLVPFSNRVGHASVVWEGTQHPQIRHSGDAPHAIQGVGAQRPWEVLDSDEASAMLSFEHRPDAAWPFAFDCSHTLRLRPDTLEMTLALTNQSAQPAPAGLGWRCCFGKRPDSRIAFAATGAWEADADQLPTRRVPSRGLDQDCAALALDRCWDGWDGLAQLRDARMRVTLRSGLTRLVVFADAARDDLAIAPVSHAPGAVHLYAQGQSAADFGLRVLQPGETLVAQLAIQAEPAP